MQNDQIYSKSLDLIQTRDDLNLLNKELELIEESSFEVGKKDISTLIRRESSFLLGSTREDIEKLRQQLTKIEFMEITFSYQPNIKLINDISLFINNNINQKILIDIKVDPMIIGGAIISYGGRFFDGSLLHKLENALKKYV